MNSVQFSVYAFILNIHLDTRIILTIYTNITNNKLQEMRNYNKTTQDFY